MPAAGDDNLIRHFFHAFDGAGSRFGAPGGCQIGRGAAQGYFSLIHLNDDTGRFSGIFIEPAADFKTDVFIPNRLRRA